MKKGESWIGRWWSAPEGRPSFGKLSREANGDFLLQLFGEWNGEDFEELPGIETARVSNGEGVVLGFRSKEPEVLWGIVGDRKITLADASCTFSERSSNPDQRVLITEFDCSTLIIGAHILKPSEEDWISECEISVDCLHLWLGSPKLMEVKRTPSAISHSGTIDLSLHHKDGEDAWIPLTQDENNSFRINRVSRASLFEVRTKNYASVFEESASVSFRAENGWSIKQVFELKNDLENLTSLAIGSRVSGARLQVKAFDGETVFWAEVIKPSTGNCDSQVISHRVQHLIFDADSVGLAEFLPEWLGFAANCRRHLGLLVELVDGSNYHVESRILLTSVLAESIHKAMFNQSGGVGEEVLKKARKISDKPRLSRDRFLPRVLDLYFRLPKVLRERILETPDAWADAVWTSRNEVTHEALIREGEFEAAIKNARILLVIVLMNVMCANGVPESRLVESLERNRFLMRCLG